ncbi:MAG: SPASM domain-containing protein [Deltaproteobacteria bacterium]|nr:SPASM domain-containing protein [Deltaproteobacteria bacterium]
MILKSPRRLLRGLRVISKDVMEILKRQSDFRSATPSTSTLFLTYRCNSRCLTCEMWKRTEEENKREIGFDGWKAVIDKLAAAGIANTEIFGGNVLLRKDLLISVLRYLKEKGFCIHLPTNQIGVDEPVARAIVDTVHRVYISTDGTGEDQNRIRGVESAFKASGSTTSMLLKLRGNRPEPRLICNTTVSSFNVGILENICEYARASGFDEIHYEYAGEFTREHVDNSIIDGLRPTPYYMRQGESILIDRSTAAGLKEKLKRIRDRYGSKHFRVITINIDSLSPEDLSEGTIPHKECRVERTEVTVDPCGNVVICPFINNYMMGNLVKEQLQAIWNNPAHLRFRQLQNSGSLMMCEHCILGVQRNQGLIGSCRRLYLNRIQPALGH